MILAWASPFNDMEMLSHVNAFFMLTIQPF